MNQLHSKSKKQIITIAGRPGSGKSTAAKAVAENLGFRHFSSGDLYRQLAHNQGVELLQANISAKAHKLLDPLVDGKLQEIGEQDNQLVIDSRLAWYWIPSSFKVFLDLDLKTAAHRILNEISQERIQNEEVINNPEHYTKVLQQRLDNEAERYKAKYGIDAFGFSNYDLVLDTAKNNSEQVVSQIVTAFKNWLD
jgi:cytidylate kinase